MSSWNLRVVVEDGRWLETATLDNAATAIDRWSGSKRSVSRRSRLGVFLISDMSTWNGKVIIDENFKILRYLVVVKH